MTARLDVTASNDPEAGLLRPAHGDDLLLSFEPEAHKVGKGPGDSLGLRIDAIAIQAPSVPLATPAVNVGKPRADGLVNRIRSVLRTLDITRDFEKTVDNRLAALRSLDHQVQHRGSRLERLNQEITVGAAHADEILRAIGSFEQPLKDLRRHKQDLQAIETTVAAFENRAQTLSTNLGRDVAGWEARARTAEQTIARLDDVSSRTLPALQERTNAAEEQTQSLGSLVTEALRMATSLTALEERLPAVSQCDQDLARIELAVPQIARQLEDLKASAEQQSRTLEGQQQRVQQTLDESQKTAHVVSELEGRIVDLTGSHQQLDRLEQCVAQLEQRAAAAAGESTHATHTAADLEQKIAVLLTQLRSMAETAKDEATKLVDLQRHAERCQQENAQRTTAIMSGLEGLEARMAEMGRIDREFDVAERHVEQLEQRAAAATGEFRLATRAKDELQREIEKCQQQIERLTSAAQGEAEKLNRLRQHGEYHGADSASSPTASDLLSTLRFWTRGTNTSREFSPAHLNFAGTAFALSAAIVLLVSIVWRVSPVEPQKPLAPASALVPPSPLTADISPDRAEASRPAPAVPAVRAPLVAVSATPVATRGVPSVAVREQSVRKEAKAPQFVGTLLVESDPPGAAAFINQEPVGRTPVLLKDLRAGSYVVRLEYEGYQRWSSAATVSAVRQERIRAKLERERSR